MIYLVKCLFSEWDDESEEPVGTRVIYKIGFTDDLKTRMSNYFHSNPGYKLVCTIPGTQDHEKRLHYKFSNLRVNKDGLREWFERSQDILDFFKSKPTLEELDKLPKNPRREDWLYRERRREVKEINLNFFDSPEKADEYFTEVSNMLGDLLSKDTYLEYIRKGGVIDEEKIDDWLKRENDLKEGNVKEDIVEVISQFKSLTTIYDKLKLLCESNQDLVEEALPYLPPSEVSVYYFRRFGVKRLKALSYNATRLKEEVKRVDFDEDQLKGEIYKSFKEGDKVSLSSIKDKLKEIYERVGFNSTPKATDLEKYFEVKNVSIYEGVVEGKKKQSRGYLLIKKKVKI